MSRCEENKKWHTSWELSASLMFGFHARQLLLQLVFVMMTISGMSLISGLVVRSRCTFALPVSGQFFSWKWDSWVWPFGLYVESALLEITLPSWPRELYFENHFPCWLINWVNMRFSSEFAYVSVWFICVELCQIAFASVVPAAFCLRWRCPFNESIQIMWHTENMIFLYSFNRMVVLTIDTP